MSTNITLLRIRIRLCNALRITTNMEWWRVQRFQNSAWMMPYLRSKFWGQTTREGLLPYFGIIWVRCLNLYYMFKQSWPTLFIILLWIKTSWTYSIFLTPKLFSIWIFWTHKVVANTQKLIIQEVHVYTWLWDNDK